VLDPARDEASVRVDGEDEKSLVNEPRLAMVSRPPGFDDAYRPMEALLHIGQLLAYIRKYGYLAPSSLDVWTYRERLTALDPACLRTLDLHGALTLEELTISLNDEGVLRLLSKKTGIRCITVETVRDWIELARRRNLVVHWAEAGSVDDRHSGDPDPRWMLSERGNGELLTPLQRFAKNNSPATMLSVIFGGGAVFGALATNRTALTVSIGLALLAIYGLAIWLYSLRDRRRNGPGAAVVAIETLRSSGKPIPALSLDT
jgi:hypothetical protein